MLAQSAKLPSMTMLCVLSAMALIVRAPNAKTVAIHFCSAVKTGNETRWVLGITFQVIYVRSAFASLWLGRASDKVVPNHCRRRRKETVILRFCNTAASG